MQSALGKPNLTQEDLRDSLPRPIWGIKDIGVYVDLIPQGAYTGSGTAKTGLWERIRQYLNLFLGKTKTKMVYHERILLNGQRPELRLLVGLSNEDHHRPYAILLEGILMLFLDTMPAEKATPHPHTPEEAIRLYTSIRQTVPDLPSLGGLNRAWPLSQGFRISYEIEMKCGHCGKVLAKSNRRRFTVKHYP